jgi:Arc/MetJ-type ribon-helix-helix transcriptional regulator
MAKSVVVKRKKKGRPAAGQDRFVGIRLPEPLLAGIAKWTEKNEATSRSEAIRRLVEIGLQFDAQERPFKAGNRARAKALAGAQIDKMGDASATGEERTERKQRLTRGPSEFREKRLDQPRKRLR